MRLDMPCLVDILGGLSLSEGNWRRSGCCGRRWQEDGGGGEQRERGETVVGMQR